VDNKLSFKFYVVRRTAAGWGVARLIRNLLLKMGIRTEALVKMIKTILVPTLIYGSEVWWKGRENDEGETKA